MTDRINDGGPAFPSHGTMGEVAQEGISLRDYFAAKAMQALVAKNETKSGNPIPDTVAGAYQYADAMLKARQS